MASTPWSPAAITAPTATTSANSSTWATNKDWTKHRALIEELYDSHKLAEVMKFMETSHNFKATSVVHIYLISYGSADVH